MTATKFTFADTWGSGIVYNPDLDEIWITEWNVNTSQRGITRVSAIDGHLIGHLQTGYTMAPFDPIVYDPVRRRIYGTDSNGNQIFDATTASYVTHRNWSRQGYTLTVDPANGNLWDVKVISSLRKIVRYDPASDTPLESYTVSSATAWPYCGIAIDSSGDGWYICTTADSGTVGGANSVTFRRFRSGVGVVAEYVIPTHFRAAVAGAWMHYDANRNAIFFLLDKITTISPQNTILCRFNVADQTLTEYDTGTYVWGYASMSLFDPVRDLWWGAGAIYGEIVGLRLVDGSVYNRYDLSGLDFWDTRSFALDARGDLWIGDGGEGALVKVTGISAATPDGPTLYPDAIDDLPGQVGSPALIGGVQVIAPGAVSDGAVGTPTFVLSVPSSFRPTEKLPLDHYNSLQVIRHPSATFADIILGRATDSIDLAPYVTQCQQSPAEVTLQLRWHRELYTPGMQPRVDELIEIRRDGVTLWVGILVAVNSYTESRGERAMSLVARSRDATPLWRETHLATDVYSISTDLMQIVLDILDAVHCGPDERILPPTLGVATVHTTTQIADLTAWDMLTTLLLTAGMAPFVDHLGRFTLVSRETQRVPSHVLGAERLIRVGGNKEKPKTTRVRVVWLDPALAKVGQQEQQLGSVTITAGFFQRKQEQDVWFSDDHTLRAENTRMVIKQSCNSGLLDVADEAYNQIDLYHGRVRLTTSMWVPTLATAAIHNMLATSSIPDYVAALGAGVTIPYGRLVHDLSEATLMVIMMSIGTGVYEIWGTPYDYVHETNRTEAFLEDVPEWAQRDHEIANDFIGTHEQAAAIAVRELTYLAMSANTYSVSVVDDLTIRPGSILDLPDGSRLYVTNYQRTLGRADAGVLDLEGFRVG